MAGGLLLAVCMGFFFIRQALVIWRWRSRVKSYIDRFGRLPYARISAFPPVRFPGWRTAPSTTTRWTDFSKAEIHPTHIRLQGADNLYIPGRRYRPATTDAWNRKSANAFTKRDDGYSQKPAIHPPKPSGGSFHCIRYRITRMFAALQTISLTI